MNGLNAVRCLVPENDRMPLEELHSRYCPCYDTGGLQQRC